MYEPIKNYVRCHGGLRLAVQGRLRDRLVEYGVEHWPDGDRDLKEVLRARMRVFIRKEYSSVIATLLISAMVNVIVKLMINWWLDRQSNRVLMKGWYLRAKKTS